MNAYRTILVAVDGSENAHRAVDMAVCLAEKYQSKLILAHVVDVEFFSVAWLNRPRHTETSDEHRRSADEALGVHAHTDSLNDYRRQYSREVLQMAAARVPDGIDSEVVHETGSPREVLLQLAEERQADLIVAGSRGLGTVAGMLVGTVSGYLVHHARVPVLVVK